MSRGELTVAVHILGYYENDDGEAQAYWIEMQGGQKVRLLIKERNDRYGEYVGAAVEVWYQQAKLEKTAKQYVREVKEGSRCDSKKEENQKWNWGGGICRQFAFGKMSTDLPTDSNLILTRLSSFSRPGGTYQAIGQGELYQHITSVLRRRVRQEQFGDIAKHLVTLADHALDLHEIGAVEQISEILMTAPLPREYQSIGTYYKASCIKRQGGYTEARAILEHLAESSATLLQYRARALQTIGATYYETNNPQEALRFYLEAAHAASPKHGQDLLTTVLSRWMIAVIQSTDGDSEGALANLERLSRPVHLLASDHPFIFYSYSNSLAVELGELGRIEEAQATCRITLASPFAHLYPELRETAKEIEQKARRASRSVVTISRGPQRADELELHAPVAVNGQSTIEQIECNSSPHSRQQGETPSLLIFPDRGVQPNEISAIPLTDTLTQKQYRQMTFGQKRALLVEIAHAGNISEKLIDRMIQLAGVISTDEETKPVEKKEIELDTHGSLEGLISLWVNGDLNPDDFASVMSALRDCQDDTRRNNIINLMISYSFHETRECMESEHEWRNRVEARLKSEKD